MATGLEDLRVLKAAEAIADDLWERIIHWEKFSRDVVGKQLAKAADSIGANIAESYGRFNYGEKLQFLYYARGSLFETKYWLNRCLKRGLLQKEEVKAYSGRLTEVGRQINSFAASLKNQRGNTKGQTRTIRETVSDYGIEVVDIVLTDEHLAWLHSATPEANP